MFQTFIPKTKSPHRGHWLIADLHIHSSYSGGSLSIKEIIKLAHLQMLDVIAISDHYEIKGSIEGESIHASNPNLPLNLISQEISVGDHFHFLMIGGYPQSWQNINRNKLMEQVEKHHHSGGVTVMAHPWTMPKSSWAMGFLKDIVAENLLDGMELFNSSILEFSDDQESLIRPFWEEWVLPYQLGVFGGSDFHYHRQGRYLGSGRTYIKVLFPGIEGVMDALRNRRCVAGLFSYRSFDLGWLGSSDQMIFGREPWYGELKQQINLVKSRMVKNRTLTPHLKHHLKKLMERGNYQLVREVLDGRGKNV